MAGRAETALLAIAGALCFLPLRLEAVEVSSAPISVAVSSGESLVQISSAAAVVQVSTPLAVIPALSEKTEAAEAEPEPPMIGIAPTQKNVVGTQDYFSNDTGLQINLPRGFNVNGAYSFYKSDITSRTATNYIGTGKNWDSGYLNFTFSWTPLANMYRSHAFEFSGAYLTPSKDFRTTVGGTFTTTYNTQLIPAPGPKKPSSSIDIRQIAGMLNLKQRIYDTKLTLDFGKTTYDREISRLSNKISPNSTRLAGLAGLLQGFPDMEWKFGAYQDIGDFLTPWAAYDHIRLLVAAQAGHGNSDSYLLGIDFFPASWVQGTLQYNYLTQTGQPASDQWGLSLALKF